MHKWWSVISCGLCCNFHFIILLLCNPPSPWSHYHNGKTFVSLFTNPVGSISYYRLWFPIEFIRYGYLDYPQFLITHATPPLNYWVQSLRHDQDFQILHMFCKWGTTSYSKVHMLSSNSNINTFFQFKFINKTVSKNKNNTWNIILASRTLF
jgi:hypothetical protein